MADDDQPSGPALVWSATSGQTYETTSDDLAATVAQVTEDDAAYQAQLLQDYLDLLALQDASRSDNTPHPTDVTA